MSVASRVLSKAGVASMGLLALLLSVAMPQTSAAQDQPAQPGQGGQGGPGGGGRGQGGPGGGGRGGNFDPEQFRQRMFDSLKERLAANDEEWGVIQPKVEKVMQLQRQQASGRGMGMLFGRGRGGPGGGGGDRGERGPGGGDRGDRGGRGGPFGGDEDSAISQRSRELQQAVENNASSEELKTKMAALREARAKAREELTKAQTELRELLTMKQEATLVMMGMIE